MNDVVAQRFSVDGKVAVVTGAASGLGRGIAQLFADCGATVMLADLNETGLAETARSIGANRAKAQPTNVADRGAVEALAEAAATQFGRIDIWVNAAGVLIYKPITEAAPDEVESILGVNLIGSYWGCAAAGRRMKAQRSGSIINFSSTGADMPSPGLSLYGITKAGVNMLTRTAAMEFGAEGIRVNAIAPGFVDTPMVAYRFTGADGNIDMAMREDTLRSRAGGSPLGLIGTPEDIALAALYLASDASRIVTGQILRVNAGVSMP